MDLLSTILINMLDTRQFTPLGQWPQTQVFHKPKKPVSASLRRA